MRVPLMDGREVELAPEAGNDRAELVEYLTREALTGSAVPLTDAWVPTATGGHVRFSAIAFPAAS